MDGDNVEGLGQKRAERRLRRRVRNTASRRRRALPQIHGMSFVEQSI